MKASGGLLSGVQRRGSEQRRLHVALVCVSTDNGRPLTGSTNLIWTVVDWLLQVAGPDVSMLVGTLAALAGEMAGICDTNIYLW